MTESLHQTKFGPIWAINKVGPQIIILGVKNIKFLPPKKAHFVPNHKVSIFLLFNVQKGPPNQIWSDSGHK